MKRILVTILGMAVLAVSAAGCGNSAETSAALTGYRLSGDGTTLVVVGVRGPEDEVLGGKVLNQDGQAVTVDIRIRRAAGDQPAIAIPIEATLTLREPLGAREVRGPSGNRLTPMTGS
jgi:hypothetical protein